MYDNPSKFAEEAKGVDGSAEERDTSHLGKL